MGLNEKETERMEALKHEHDAQSPVWALQIGEALLRTAAHHTASLNAQHKSQGIKLTPLSLLYATMDHGGRVSQKTLTERFPYSVQAMTLALNSLEKSKLIERETDTDDKRANYICLTSAGLDCIQRALRYRKEYYDQLTELLTEEEATMLVATLNKIDQFYRKRLIS